MYFGVGQELSCYPDFIVMEEPHKKMHTLGKKIYTSDQGDNIAEMIKDFNIVFEKISFHLHGLEAQLVDYDIYINGLAM